MFSHLSLPKQPADIYPPPRFFIIFSTQQSVKIFSTLRCLENKETRLEKFINVCGEASFFSLFGFCSFSTRISHFFLKGQFLPLPLTKQVLKVSSTSANARLFVSLLKLENKFLPELQP